MDTLIHRAHCAASGSTVHEVANHAALLASLSSIPAHEWTEEMTHMRARAVARMKDIIVARYTPAGRRI